MRARYYDSVSGRFINRDIVSGTIEDSRSLNRYAYCYGNPVSYADPFGLSPLVSMRNHAILDVLGMIPGGIGIAADLMNALYYIAEGDVKQAIESVVMSAFSVALGEIVKNIIGISIGCFGIYGGLNQVKEDIDRYFANWDVYSNEERLLEAQILACHLLSLGGSIAGTISAAEGCVKSDAESKQADNVKKVSEAVTDTSTTKFDKATQDRINALVEAWVLSPDEIPQYTLNLQLLAESSVTTKTKYYQVTSKENANAIINSDNPVLKGIEFREVYVWTEKPTLSQARNSGARFLDTVIEFETSATFSADTSIWDKSLCDIARISDRPGPISISNVIEVGFKEEGKWWQFWKK